jgi:heterotetrameric sarcosine oxidase gamma subunit
MTTTIAVRRSALEVEHEVLGARWAAAATRFATDFGDPSAEADGAARGAGLAELGPLDKALVRGPDAADVVSGAALGTATWVLAPDEIILMARPDFDLIAIAAARLAPDVSVVDVSSRWALLRLGGPLAAKIMTELTTLDLDPTRFADGRIAQGHMVNVPAIVRRHDAICGVAYSFLVHRDHAAYAWDAIARIGRAHGLRVVGSEALARKAP